MRTSLTRVITFIALFVAAAFTTPAAPAHASPPQSITWDETDDLGPGPCERASAHYHVAMSCEPDWCLYQGGDVVFVKWSSSGQIVGWYVYHWYDANPTPPDSTWDSIPYFVSEPSLGWCGLFQPW